MNTPVLLRNNGGEPLPYDEHPEYYDAIKTVSHTIIKAIESRRAADSDDLPKNTVAFVGAMPDESGRTVAINSVLELAAQGLRVAYLELDGLPSESFLKLFDEKMPADLPEIHIPEGWKLLSGSNGLLIAYSKASELIFTDTRELFNTMSAHFDCVVVNLPSLLLSSTSSMLADLCGASILVAKQDVSDFNSLKRAGDLLAGLRSEFLGCLLSDYDYRKTNRYDEYYHYRRRLSGRVRK